MQMYFSLPHTIKIAKSNNYLKNEYTQTALNSTPLSMKYQILNITPFQTRRNHGLQVRTDWFYPIEHGYYATNQLSCRAQISHKIL
jgi:hypothetical protein